jgi:hypothetical protein
MAWLGARDPGRCSRCGTDLRTVPALVVGAAGDLAGWLLCATDGADFLNSLRTVEPKLDPASFVLPVVPSDAAVALRGRSRGAKGTT